MAKYKQFPIVEGPAQNDKSVGVEDLGLPAVAGTDSNDIGSIDEVAKKTVAMSAQSGLSLNRSEAAVSASGTIQSELNRNKGKIGFWEAATSDLLEKVPFSPVGAMKLLDILTTSRRIQKDDYDSAPLIGAHFPRLAIPSLRPGRFQSRLASDPTQGWTPEGQRKRDQKVYDDYFADLLEQQKRGTSFGGKVGGAVSQLPAWMVEFALTGGLKKIGSKVVKDQVKRSLRRRLARGAAGVALGTGLQVTVGMPHRVVESTLQRRLHEDPENWATSVALGWGDVFIEALSERGGAGVAAGAKAGLARLAKLPFGKKFLAGVQSAWMDKTGKGAAEAVKNLFTKAGYDGMLLEIGEERLATLLHALVGTNDFGAGDEAGALSRIASGFNQDWENRYVELLTLAVPGGAKLTSEAIAKGLDRGQVSETEIAQTEAITDFAETFEAVSEEKPSEVVSAEEVTEGIEEEPTSVEGITTPEGGPAVEALPDQTPEDAQRALAIWQQYLQTGDAAILEDLPPGAIIEVTEDDLRSSLVESLNTPEKRTEFKSNIDTAIGAVELGEVDFVDLVKEITAYDKRWGSIDPLSEVVKRYVNLTSEGEPGAISQTVKTIAEKQGFKIDETGAIIAFHGTDRPIEGDFNITEQRGAFFSSSREEARKFGIEAAKRSGRSIKDVQVIEVRLTPSEIKDLEFDDEGNAIIPETGQAFITEEVAGDIEIRDPSAIHIAQPPKAGEVEAAQEQEKEKTFETEVKRQQKVTERINKEAGKASEVLSKKLKEVKTLSEGERVLALEQFRKKQAVGGGKIGTAEQKKGSLPSQVIGRSKLGFGGQSGTPVYAPPKLTSNQWESLFAKTIEVYPFFSRQFEQVRAGDALSKIRKGQMLTNNEIALLSPIIGEKTADQLAKTIQKSMTREEKFWLWAQDFIMFWKSPFNYDIQFARNSVDFVLTNPVKVTKGLGVALRAYFSQQYADNIMKDVKSDPRFAEAVSRGTVFLESGKYAAFENLPEQYHSRLPLRMSTLWKDRPLPIWIAGLGVRGAGRWMLASERSMAASMDWFKMELWNKRSGNWAELEAELGQPNLSRSEKVKLKDQLVRQQRGYADVLNTFTKTMRARSSTGRAIQRTANFVLWSPSMTFARFRKPILIATASGNRMEVAKLLTANIAKIYLMGTTLQIAANAFRGEDDEEVTVELDPTSSNWGRVKVKNTWYDFGGGEIQHYRAMARVITGKMKKQSGRKVDIERFRAVGDFLSSRQTAAIGIFKSIFQGVDNQGKFTWILPTPEEFDEINTPMARKYADFLRSVEDSPTAQKATLLARFMWQHLAPGFSQAMLDATIQDGWASSVGALLTEAGALSTTSYRKGARAELETMEDLLAQRHRNVPWDGLSIEDQKNIRDEVPEFGNLETRIRREDQQWSPRKFSIPSKEQAKQAKRTMKKLPSDVQRELQRLGLTTGFVKRTIETDFYLNDNRFKKYEDMAAKEIVDRLTELTHESSYRGSTDTNRADEIKRVLKEAKDAARSVLVDLINEYAI